MGEEWGRSGGGVGRDKGGVGEGGGEGRTRRGVRNEREKSGGKLGKGGCRVREEWERTRKDEGRVGEKWERIGWGWGGIRER